jgi:hypothetical protein
MRWVFSCTFYIYVFTERPVPNTEGRWYCCMTNNIIVIGLTDSAYSSTTEHVLSNTVHGLSRKFPNVQNSPPLRRPSGARQVLLSSNEFDELCRENRIALSCLVIVLCFFMWSHVWRFSRDKKMSVFHEQRICAKIGKSVTETLKCWKQHSGKKPCAGLKRTSGGNVSNRAELRLMMIRAREGHQRRKLTIMLQKFVKLSVKIVVWQFER